MIVSHNTQALNAIRLVNVNLDAYSRSTQKVSSGYKINKAGDYPAGLALSETMRRQVRGLNKGIENAKNGVEVCKIADGALSEVTEMIQRINELSIKAANGTNTLTDRHYIQQEIDQLLTEINRIADTTTFNELPIFKGTNEIASSSNGSSWVEGDIPFSDFTIADVQLGNAPFSSSDSANHLALQAVINNTGSAAHGYHYNLIFGDGGTSYSSFRLSYQDADGLTKQEIISMGSLSATNYEEGEADGMQFWKRSFVYENEDGIKVRITQQVTADIPEDPMDEKKYNISYSFSNETETDTHVSLDFMFHADTAYNNNDICEGYYVNGADGNGSRLNEYCMYTDGGEWSSSLTNGASEHVTDTIPDSFSIIDTDNALAFSERISFAEGSVPDALSIGLYYSIFDWNYYENLDQNLGENAIRKDLGFSLFWNNELDAGSTNNVSFSYGIVAAEQDNNLNNVPIHKNENVVSDHTHLDEYMFWIQSGNEKDSGIWLEIPEINTEVLGLKDVDVTTAEGADATIEAAKNALHSISESRSRIGAQQNRMEHTVINEESIVEKVESSESRIRDLDLSAEMIKFSNLNMLLKIGENMISEANQNIEKLLNILQ